LAAIDGNAYSEKAEFTAALRVQPAGLKQRLAWRLVTMTSVTSMTFIISFVRFAAGSGGSKCNEGHSKENGGFEELHGSRSEDVGVRWD
jgi:hypothetical protein